MPVPVSLDLERSTDALANKVCYTCCKIFLLINFNNRKEIAMANCSEMKEGEIFVCEKCGLELRVHKTCRCGGADGTDKCSVPLQCCGQEMVKTVKATIL
ncbi:MAG: hypothetical protein ACI8PB_001607 [Desulforhopalus sp.]